MNSIEIFQRGNNTDPFEFDLDIKIVYSNSVDSNDSVLDLKSLKITEKEHDIAFDIHTDSNSKMKLIEFFSIDPDLKILKEILIGNSYHIKGQSL